MLQISLLGTFQVMLEGEPLTGFRSDKTRAMLAYLAVEHGRVHRREALATLLWGENATSKDARVSLRSALYNLRQTLAPVCADNKGQEVPLLDVTRNTLRFNVEPPACWVDTDVLMTLERACQAHPHTDLVRCASCIQRLTRMVELYRGDFLAGLTLPDSPAFEDWRLVQQEAYHRQILTALNTLIAHYRVLGSYDQVIRYARRQIELEPWREEGHRALIEALALSGQRSAALAQYESCCQILQATVGVTPEAETVALTTQIREGELGWDSAVTEPENPYKGLRAFVEEDAGDFFGREALVARLLRQMMDPALDEVSDRRSPAWMARFLAVVGPSGSGKSSVVRAGLIPALRRRPDPWLIATMVPGKQPMAELAAALVQALPALGQRKAGGTTQVSDYLGQSRNENVGAISISRDVMACPPKKRPSTNKAENGLAHLLADHVPAGARLLLVVDQAEELFNPHVDPVQRDDFTHSLLAALRAPRSPLYVIVTLRADAYDMPLSDPDWGRLFAQRVEVTLPLTPEELHRAIVAPAHRVSKYIQPELGARLVADASRSPGALPLLQYTLTELYEQCEGQTMTLAQYQALGGLAGALVQRVDALYDSLLPAEQTLARQIFMRLVTPGRVTMEGRVQPDTRRRALHAELAALTGVQVQPMGDPRDAEGCDLDMLLDLFSRYRLLTLDHDQATGAATVELAHEALIAQWDRLRRWLAIQRDDMRQHQRFVTLAETWEQAERDPSFLITGQQLQRFEAWASATVIVLTAAERDYLRASQEAYATRLAQEAAQQAREATLARKVQSLYLTTSAQLALQERNTDLALALTVAANRIPDAPPDVHFMLAEAAYAPGTIRRFIGHTSQVLCVALSPDGRTLLSGGADNAIIWWDVQTGEVIRRFVHHAPVHSVAFLPLRTPGLGNVSGGSLLLGEVSDRHPPGELRVLSATMDTSLLLWNLSGDVLLRLEGHTAPTRCLAVNTEGTRALSGAEDGRLCWWDLESGHLLRQWAAHSHPVCSVAIAPSGMRAISGDVHGNVSVWDMETGERVYHWPAHLTAMDAVRQQEGHFDAVWDVTFSPDGRAAISVAEDESVLLWDLETGTLKRRLKQLQLGLFSVAFLPDGHDVLLGTIDGRVVRQGITGSDYDEDLYFVGHTGRVTDLVVSSDGRAAFSSSADGTLRQWDLQSGAEVRRLDYAPAISTALDLSPDGAMGVTGFWDGDLLLWDYETGTTIRHLQGHRETLFAGARFSPDNRRVLTGGGAIFAPAKDPTLRWWDVASGQELQQLAVHARGLYGVALSPDGSVAVSAGKDGQVYLWDIANDTHKLLFDLTPQIARSVAISHNGQWAMIGPGRGDSPNPDYAVRLLNLATGEVQRRDIGHKDSVGAVAFSPDGRRALSGDHGKGLILWDIESGRPIHRLVGHMGSCMGVTFSADGHRALSASNDHTVILWDLVEGIALRRFWGHKVVVFRAIFGPKGDTALSVSSDGTVREWRIDATTDDLLAWIADHRYVPELTEAQRAQYNLDPRGDAAP